MSLLSPDPLQRQNASHLLAQCTPPGDLTAAFWQRRSKSLHGEGNTQELDKVLALGDEMIKELREQLAGAKVDAIGCSDDMVP